jgi:hypothetical protein
MTEPREFAENVRDSLEYYEVAVEYIAIRVNHHGAAEGYGVFVLEEVEFVSDLGEARLYLRPTGAGEEDAAADYSLSVDPMSKSRRVRLHENPPGDARYREVGDGANDIRTYTSSSELDACDAVDLSALALWRAIGVRVRESDESAAERLVR